MALTAGHFHLCDFAVLLRLLPWKRSRQTRLLLLLLLLL